MKRTVYIISLVLMLAVLLGGVSAFADFNEEISARVPTYPDSSVALAADDTDLVSATDAATGEDVSSDDSEEGNEAGDTPAKEPENSENGTQGGTLEEISPDGTPESTEGDTAPEESTPNPFEKVFGVIKENAGEIFSALAFLSTMVVAFAYKKGLIPLLKSGLGAISGVVGGIKDSSKRGEEISTELRDTVNAKLGSIEGTISTLTSSLNEVESGLAKLSLDATEREKMRLILSAQIDMLYSVFMTSSLPQYQKDEVGERVRVMKEALKGNDDE